MHNIGSALCNDEGICGKPSGCIDGSGGVGLRPRCTHGGEPRPSPTVNKTLKRWHTGITAAEGANGRVGRIEPGKAMHGLGFGSQWASGLAFVFLVSGCMQSRVDESRELHTRIQKNEAVVILAKPQVEGASAEDQFMHCVAAELQGRDGAITTRTDEQFTDALFPWFEPGTAPTKPEGVAALLTRPGVAERVAESGVRYVVWLDGGTQKTDGGGSLACGASPGVAGCIGFGWWEKEANYEATIWDLKQAKAAGSVGTNVTGTSAVIGALLPLPFIARVQATACNRMGTQLRTFFTGGDDEATPAPARASIAQAKTARK